MYCLGLLEVELETEVSADVDGVESGVAMAGTAKGDEIATFLRCGNNSSKVFGEGGLLDIGTEDY